MNAPNRSAEVNGIVKNNSALLNRGKDAGGVVVDVDAYETGRRELLERVVRALNVEDDRKWGVLEKTDQGGKIPVDILVWRDTMEVFDVFAGNPDRASWQPLGVNAEPAWVWHSVDDADAGGGAEPVDPVVNPDDEDYEAEIRKLFAAAATIAESFHSLGTNILQLKATIDRLNEKGVRLHF